MTIKNKRKPKSKKTIKREIDLMKQITFSIGASLLLGSFLTLGVVIKDNNAKAKERAKKIEREEEYQTLLEQLTFDAKYKYTFDTNAQGFIEEYSIYELTEEWLPVNLYRAQVEEVSDGQVFTDGNWEEIGSFLTKNPYEPFTEANAKEIDGEKYPNFIYAHEEIVTDGYERLVARIKNQKFFPDDKITENFLGIYIVGNYTIPLNETEPNFINIYTYERKNNKEWQNDGYLYLSTKRLVSRDNEHQKFQYLGRIDLDSVFTKEETYINKLEKKEGK